MLPGTNKIGCVGFCWGGRYAILQAHGQEKTGEGSSIGGVDAAVAHHPVMLEIPGDLEPVKMPLSLAVGDRDSLLDMKSVGKIQDLLAVKTEVPHELRVSFPTLFPLFPARGVRGLIMRFFSVRNLEAD